MKKLFVLSCLLVVIWSCSSNETEPLPSTSNEILDSLLAGAPYSFVDLDRIPIDTLIIERANILGGESAPSQTPPGFLQRVTGMVTFGDSLYVADDNSKQIWAVNSTGELVRSIGREGGGPGEFRNLGGLARNSNYIFANDVQLLRTSVYDTEFNFVTYMNHLKVSGDASQFVTTDSLVFLPDREPAAIDRIRYYRATPPFEKVGTFFPRIIPKGMGPAIVNNYNLSANLNSVNGIHHAVSYTLLPYLFLYDENLQLVRTLVLQGAVYDELDQPYPEPQGIVTTDPLSAATQSGFSPFIGQMALAGDGSLFLEIRNPFTLYHIVPQGDKYEVKSVMRFAFEDTVNNTIQSLDQIDNMYIDSNALYISRRFIPYVFRINI